MSDSPPIKKILVPVDGSDFSFTAAKYAISLAKLSGAEVEFFHAIVNPPYITYPASGMMIPHYLEDAQAQAIIWFNELKAMAEAAGVKAAAETSIDVVSIADTITRYAQEHKHDLIVIGTRGRSAIKRFLLGSVASGVVAHAGCSVLVVR